MSNIVTVRPGWNLDKFVAEKVMGWTFTEEETWSPNTEIVWRDADGRKVYGTQFSTDIAHAWPVVERLRENGWLLSLTPDTIEGGWAVQYKRLNENFHDWVRAKTAALAICLAALNIADT